VHNDLSQVSGSKFHIFVLSFGEAPVVLFTSAEAKLENQRGGIARMTSIIAQRKLGLVITVSYHRDYVSATPEPYSCATSMRSIQGRIRCCSVFIFFLLRLSFPPIERAAFFFLLLLLPALLLL